MLLAGTIGKCSILAAMMTVHNRHLGAITSE